jgi:hypothetical protein
VAVVITDLSPESTDQFAGSSDIFVFDVATGAQTRITTSANREQSIAPVWSPDGTQIAYLALRNGTNGLYRKASNGQGAEELLYKHIAESSPRRRRRFRGRHAFFSELRCPSIKMKLHFFTELLIQTARPQ